MTTIQKTISDELQSLIDQANSTFGKAKEIVMAAYSRALDDGFTPQEAKDLLLEKITVFKKSTLYSYIPGEAKSRVGRPKGKASLISKVGNSDSIKETVPKLERIEPEDESSRIEHLPDAPSAVEQWQAQANVQNEVEELRKQLVEVKKPYVVETILSIKGIDIPVIIEVIPSKKFADISVDEQKARRIGL